MPENMTQFDITPKTTGLKPLVFQLSAVCCAIEYVLGSWYSKKFQLESFIFYLLPLRFAIAADICTKSLCSW